jgi:hypothetical protein
MPISRHSPTTEYTLVRYAFVGDKTMGNKEISVLDSSNGKVASD